MSETEYTGHLVSIFSEDGKTFQVHLSLNGSSVLLKGPWRDNQDAAMQDAYCVVDLVGSWHNVT